MRFQSGNEAFGQRGITGAAARGLAVGDIEERPADLGAKLACVDIWKEYNAVWALFRPVFVSYCRKTSMTREGLTYAQPTCLSPWPVPTFLGPARFRNRGR
jgi:hypothetical protein